MVTSFLLILLTLLLNEKVNAEDECDNMILNAQGPHRLAGYAAHSEFYSVLKSLLDKKILQGTMFMVESSTVPPGTFLSDTSSEEYTFYQLIHSLVVGDVIYANLLIEVLKEMDVDLRSMKSGKSWNTEMKFSTEKMYLVADILSQGNSTGLRQLPSNVNKNILSILSELSVFQMACSTGNTNIIKWFLASGFNVTGLDLGVLEEAFKNSHSDIVELLLERHIMNTNIVPKSISTLTNSKNETLLHYCAKLGLDICVNTLIRAGAYIDMYDAKGYSPLSRAVIANKYSTIQILLREGASGNWELNGDSLLHVSSYNGNFEVFEAFMKLGVPISKKNKFGLTAGAISEKLCVDAGMQYLELKGIHMSDNMNSDLNFFPVPFLMVNEDPISYLSLTSFHNDRISNSKMSSIFLDILKNHSKLVKIYLDKGGETSIDKKILLKLLYPMVMSGDLMALQCVLNLGADPNLSNEQNESPLSIAASLQKFDIASKLLMKTNDSNATLYLAAARGQSPLIMLLLDRGLRSYLSHPDNRTLLHVAASNGQLEAVKLLIDRSFNINDRTIGGMQAIHLAALEGHHDVVGLLIDRGNDVNSIELGGGRTPLQEAAHGGHVKVVDLLLKRGANINGKTSEGKTALFESAFMGHEEVVKFLVEKGADITLKTSNGQTAFDAATAEGHSWPVKYLLKKESTINGISIPTKGGMPQTTCDCANLTDTPKTTPPTSQKKTNEKETPQVTKTPGSKNTIDESMFYVASTGSIPMLKKLLTEGADPNTKNSDGWTVLHNAAEKNQREAIKLLVQYGANKDGQTKTGWSVIQTAVESGNIESVKLLLEIGANPNAVTSDGWSVIHTAADTGNVEILSLLLKNKGDPNAKNSDGWSVLHTVVQQKKSPVVKALLDGGANPNIKNKDGWTALHAAVETGDLNIINLLIDAGADLNKKLLSGWSVLHAAVEERKVAVVELLLKRGADPDIKDINGWSAFHVAVEKADIGAINAFLENKVNINLSTKDGWSVLHLAAEKGNVAVLKVLLDSGANINIKTNGGVTPLDIAKAKKQAVVINLLIKRGAKK